MASLQEKIDALKNDPEFAHLGITDDYATELLDYFSEEPDPVLAAKNYIRFTPQDNGNNNQQPDHQFDGVPLSQSQMYRSTGGFHAYPQVPNAQPLPYIPPPEPVPQPQQPPQPGPVAQPQQPPVPGLPQPVPTQSPPLSVNNGGLGQGGFGQGGFQQYQPAINQIASNHIQRADAPPNPSQAPPNPARFRPQSFTLDEDAGQNRCFNTMCPICGRPGKFHMLSQYVRRVDCAKCQKSFVLNPYKVKYQNTDYLSTTSPGP